MRIELLQESPLVGARNLLTDAPQHMLDQVRIQERPFLELNNIRGNSAEPEFVQAIKDVVGVELPVRPNTVAVGRAYALWWLGPDEWLAQSPHAIPARLDSELREPHHNPFAGTGAVTTG